MNQGILKQIIAEGEGELVEFKESPRNLEREICAFANTQGGKIYIGITDSGMVKKTKLTNKLKSQIQTQARSLEPNPNLKIESFSEIIMIHVEESTNKPVKAPQGFFVRMGANSQKLSRDEILEFAVKEFKIQFDKQLYLEEEATSLIHSSFVELYRLEAKLDKNINQLQLLENLGCLVIQNQIPYLTNAGVLFFAKNSQKIFPQATVTVLKMSSEDQIEDQKIISPPLFQQMETAFQKIRDHLNTAFEITSLKRKENLEIPEATLRELLLNAIIHRDYFEVSADITVKVFPHHIEFSNPGSILHKVPLEKLYGKSIRRNPILAELFQRAGYIERAGTGLIRIRNALRSLGLPGPDIHEDGFFFVNDIARIGTQENSFLNAAEGRWRDWCFLGKNKAPFLTKEYADHFHISTRMVLRELNQMVEKGLLRKRLQGRKIFFFEN